MEDTESSSGEELGYTTPEEYIQNCCGGNAEELPDDFIEYLQGEKPKYPKWKLTPMYMRDEKGNTRIWQTGFDGINQWTLYGPATKTTITLFKITKNNTGRSLQEQAIIKCSNDYKKKWDGNYRTLSSNQKITLKGMSGYPYKEGCVKDWSLASLSIKFDGHRMLCHYSTNDKEIVMLSNGGENLNYMTHIREQVLDFISYLPPDVVIDGELFSPDLPRNKIASIVRSHKNHRKDMSVISYYIFDINYAGEPHLKKRHTVLKNAFIQFKENMEKNGTEPHLVFVPQFLAGSEKQMMKYFKDVVNDGYEGVVIRFLAGGAKKGTKQHNKSIYHYGKSTRMYKVKEWEDTEGPVVDVVNCKGKETGLGMLVIEDEESGRQINIRWGTNEKRKKWLKNPDKVIGRILQYKFSQRHEKTNLPIEPTGVRWRDRYN